jgi:predicted AAA+ superfamily ATPase
LPIQRDIIGEIEPYLKRREYVAVVGPRQCGKTTLFEMIKAHLIGKLGADANNVHLVTFEDRRLLRQFEEDPVSFVQSFRRAEGNMLYLMLDEFQYTRNGGQKLKLVYDTVRDLKILVTGSSSLEIRAGVGAYMVGRMLTFHLYPFSFRECLRAADARFERIYYSKRTLVSNWLNGDEVTVSPEADPFRDDMARLYEQHCIWGGYPAVVLSRTEREKAKILAGVYNSYVLKDIKGLLELDTERSLFLLSQHLAVQIGNIIVYQSLGRIADLNFRQLKRHLRILKDTYVCTDVPPFFANRRKELVKNPKIYFFDTGFRNFLMENMGAIQKRPDGGSLVENAVYIRLVQIKKEVERVHFWRTKAGAEVDFVLKKGVQVFPIEVKYASYCESRVPRGMISFIESFKPTRGLVLTRDYWGMKKIGSTDILFAPVYYL